MYGCFTQFSYCEPQLLYSDFNVRSLMHSHAFFTNFDVAQPPPCRFACLQLLMALLYTVCVETTPCVMTASYDMYRK